MSVIIKGQNKRKQVANKRLVTAPKKGKENG